MNSTRTEVERGVDAKKMANTWADLDMHMDDAYVVKPVFIHC